MPPLEPGSGTDPRSGVAGIIMDQLEATVPGWTNPAAEDAAKAAVEANALGIVSSQKSLTGFEDPAKAQHSYDDGTRTYTISPVAASYRYWIAGIPYTVTDPVSIVTPDVEGAHFIYYNGATLETTNTLGIELFRDHAIVARIRWDKDNQEAIYVGNERHALMPWETHYNIHFGDGARYLGGLMPTGMITDGDGDTDSHAQAGWLSGSLLDEDIEHAIAAQSAPGTWPKFYRSGAAGNWYRTTDDFLVVTAGGGRAAWNEFTGGAWQLSEVGNGNYVTSFVVATNDPDQPMVVLIGQVEYATLHAARAGIGEEIEILITDGLPSEELIFVAAILIDTKNTYSNAVKSRAREIETDVDFVDLTGLRVNGVVTRTTRATAIDVAADTSAFGGVLSGADSNVQAALNTIDDHTHAGAAHTHRYDVSLTAQIDGIKTVFLVGEPYTSGTTRLHWQGQRQEEGYTYDETNPAAGEITTTFTPPAGTRMSIDYEV